MPAYISRPRTVFGAHKISTAEIVDDIRSHHAEHPRLGAIVRVVNNCGVRTRFFARPLQSPTVSGTADVGERARATFQDALDLAERAAAAALDSAGLTALDIDAVITSHSTGWSVPNLDVHLAGRLGLRPTVRRLALTTLACAGGTQALILAADHVTARPSAKVLVVGAEAISGVYHHGDTSMQSMVYKVLFGDSASAAVVTSQPLTPGLAIEDSFEYLLPESVDRYSGRIAADGFHFDSTKEALTAADDVLPSLVTWLGPRHTDFPVIHPGSPRIIADTAAALGLSGVDARHSTATLADEGNLGAPSVLRILERTHDEPPAPGSRGTMVAYGPGFTTAALHGHWHG
ncbi:PhlD [Streptomyces sp. cg35]|uniref:thiolase family protein n=1 Tax=Streptomyces sp. cg35 TaxID=3421650 RepID=UPI003D17897B